MPERPYVTAPQTPAFPGWTPEAYRAVYGPSGILRFRCPLTGRPMRDPVQGALCRHPGSGYEREALAQLLAGDDDEYECSVPGCGQPLEEPLETLEHLGWFARAYGHEHTFIRLGKRPCGKRPCEPGNEVANEPSTSDDETLGGPGDEMQVDEVAAASRETARGRYRDGFQEALALYGNLRTRLDGQNEHLANRSADFPSKAPRIVFRRYLADCVRVFARRFPYWMPAARRVYAFKCRKIAEWRRRKQIAHRLKRARQHGLTTCSVTPPTSP